MPARLRAAAPPTRIDAPLDFFGGGYVAMAVEDFRRHTRGKLVL